jgi:hypothetical protein
MSEPVIQFERRNGHWRALMRFRRHRLSSEGVTPLAAAEGLKSVLDWQAMTSIMAEDLAPMVRELAEVIESHKDPDRLHHDAV